MKKRRPTTKYEKRNLADEFFKPMTQSNSQNLEDCIKEIFPDTKLTDLKTWSKTIRKESIEPEPLLFMALICGAHFQISRPEVTECLSALSEWFTVRQMNSELVDVVIEALAPGIRKAVEERGYMQGWPHGEYVIKKGHPMTARGAWVAAFVIENHLRQVGKKSTVAKALAVELVSILSGRKEKEIEVGEEVKPWEGVKLNEFYRIYKNAPKDVIAILSTELLKTYMTTSRTSWTEIMLTTSWTRNSETAMS